MLTLHSRVVCALCSWTSYLASLAICFPSWKWKKLGFYVSNPISCKILRVHDFIRMMRILCLCFFYLLFLVPSHSRPLLYTSILTKLRLHLSLYSHFFLTIKRWQPPICRWKTQYLTWVWTTKQIWFRASLSWFLFKDCWLNARWSRRQI